MVILRSVRPDGGVDDLKVTDRGGTVACAFGRPGVRSSIWIITVSAEGGGYVTTPSCPARWKINLDGPVACPDAAIQSSNGLVSVPGLVRPRSRLLDQPRPSGCRGAPDITTALSVLVLPEDVQPLDRRR